MHPTRLRYCILTDELTRAILCFPWAHRSPIGESMNQSGARLLLFCDLLFQTRILLVH